MGAPPETPADPVLIIACGALAREILALTEANGLSHVSLQCLPAELHNRPERIAAAVREAIREARPHYQHIVVGYADCGTGGALDRVLAEENIARIAGPHCYAFYSGLKDFADTEESDLGTFYLTDFLARHFDTLVYKSLGLDRHPELREQYFKHYSRLVYLAQSDDEELLAEARRAAEKLHLNFELRRTGYGDLQNFVAAL